MRSDRTPKATSSQADDLRSRAEAWFRRGDADLDREDIPAALQSFQASLKLARQLNDGSLISRNFWKLADVHILHLQEYEKALSFAREALSAARQASDRQQEAWALDQIGNAYFFRAYHSEALRNFRAALTLMQQVGDRFGQATAGKNLGITYRTLGQSDEAAELLHQALEIFRELNAAESCISTLQNLGMLYSDIGEYHLALDAYQQALNIDPRNGNANTQAVYVRIGQVYLDMNMPEQALEYFRQALAAFDRNPWVLRGLSGALLGVGQMEEAIEVLQRSLSIDRQLKDAVGLATDFWSLGQLYLDRDPDIAIVYLQQARRIMEKRNFHLTWGLYPDLAQAYRQKGDLDHAIEYYQKAIEKLEGVRVQVRSQQYRAGFLGKHHGIYQGLIEALMERHAQIPQGGDDARAFAVFEAAKARTTVEGIAESRLDIWKDLEPQLGQRELRLSTRITELQRRLIDPGTTKAERGQVLQDLSQAEQESDQLVVEIKRRDPHYAALRYPEPLRLERAQALLDGHTAFLAYLVTHDQVFTFVLTANTFHAKPLAVSPNVMAARVQNYIDLLSQGDSAGSQNMGRRLFIDLLAPVSGYLLSNINRLIIIPDGVLHYLPFESLIQTSGQQTGDAGSNLEFGRQQVAAGNRYLVEDFTVSYAPSTTALAALDKSRAMRVSGERADLLVFANPAPARALIAQTTPQREAETTRGLYDSEGLQITAIPFAAAEAKAITWYAHQGTIAYTGDDASERRVKTERIDRFRIIHFASHALISDWMPRRSALVLASGAGDKEDGFLQAWEIYRLKLDADLVVLSACQTARGRILAGEGVQGLAQAFFYAGAKSAVVSLWNVNDERTATFMAAFYRHLAAGQSKAEALRAAKLDMLQDSATSAPRYWAPFILIGEADRPVPISEQLHWFGDARWQLFGVTLFLAVLIALFLVRKLTAKAPRARSF